VGRSRLRGPLATIRAVPWTEVLLVIAGFGLMSILISWPLLRDIDDVIAGGGGGGDPAGYAWDLWYNATHGLSFWGTTTQEVVSAPFGRESPSAVNATLFVTVGPGWVVASLFGPVAAYNALVLMGLTLSASAMYLLIRWLGLGVAPAIWAGAAFMVFPYEQLRATVHIPLAQLWCFPLLILAGVRWLEMPGWRRAGWVTVALGACWLTNPYYGIMGLVIVGVFAVAAAVVVGRRSGVRRAAMPLLQVGAWTAGLVAVPLLVLQSSASGALDTSLGRSRIELEIYGARLTDYLLPSADNSFFSGLVGPENWASIGSPGGERTAFVGYVTIALALIGVALGVRRRERIGRRLRLALVTAVPLIAVLVVFSLASPTRILGTQLTMPSSLVFDVAPYVRVFARFAAPVMAVLLVLAALGLRELIRDRSDLVRASVIAVVLIGSAMELPNGAPAAAVIRSAPPVVVDGRTAEQVPTWRWLRDNRDGEIVFEQPGGPNEFLDRYFMFGQTVHGHPIVNGGLSVRSIATDFARANQDVRWPGIAPRLAGLGVDLVAVNPWFYGALGMVPPDVADPPPGFRVLRRFGDGSAVWEVVARPAAAVAIPRAEGWWDPELRDGRIRRWMHTRARVTVVAPEAGDYVLRTRARGLEGDYTLSVTASGDTVGTAAVGPEDGDVAIPVTLPAGESDLWLVSDRPPRRIGGGDLRVVTMQLSDVTLTRAGSG